MSETYESVLARIPDSSTVLCIGLHVFFAEVFSALAVHRRPLPWAFDREPVDELDIRSGHYRRRDMGIPRTHALFRMLARRTSLALPREGHRAEGCLVDKASRDYLDGALEQDSWIQPLMARFDVVLHVVSAEPSAEWDLPISPQTRVLQFHRDASGLVRLVATGPWGQRFCQACIRQLAVGDEPDCVCRLAAPSGRRAPLLGHVPLPYDRSLTDRDGLGARCSSRGGTSSRAL